MTPFWGAFGQVLRKVDLLIERHLEKVVTTFSTRFNNREKWGQTPKTVLKTETTRNRPFLAPFWWIVVTVEFNELSIRQNTLKNMFLRIIRIHQKNVQKRVFCTFWFLR